MLAHHEAAAQADAPCFCAALWAAAMATEEWTVTMLRAEGELPAKTRGRAARPRAVRRTRERIDEASHWSTVASAARPRLDRLRYGDRELGLKEIAAEFAVSAQTLRRWIAASRFIDDLKMVFDDTDGLRRAPVATIEHISRWYAYDAQSALAAAQQLLQENLSVAAVGAAERQARKAGKSDGVGRSLVHACRQRVMPVLKAEMTGYEMETPRASHAYEPSVDFRFRRQGARKWSAVAVIMGPYRDRSLYEIRLGDWLVRVLGLSMIYDRVMLVVPTREIEQHCRRWLAANKLKPRVVEFRVIAPDMG